jgi:hypothetical protein
MVRSFAESVDPLEYNTGEHVKGIIRLDITARRR